MLFFAIYVVVAVLLANYQARRLTNYYRATITPTPKVYLTYLVTLPILLPYFAKQIPAFLWYKS